MLRIIMKRYFLIAIFFLFSTPSISFACSCGTGEPAHEFNRARMIFIGRMRGGSEKWVEKDQAGKSHSLEAGDVRFAVEEVFKGKEVGEVTVVINSHMQTSCGPYGLKRGERYLVYAYASEEGEKQLYTGVCTRTTTVSSEYAKEDLDFLRNLPPAGSGGNLQGRIWADLKQRGATPLRDVRIKIISADEQVITAFTDGEGEFLVKQLKPGKYRVEPDFPPNYSSEHKSAEVNVDDRGTASVGFEVYIDGKVAGRILDKEGNTYNSIFLHLVEGERDVYGHSTGEDGGFDVKRVPPGHYLLYIKLENPKYESKPYYYPGTFARERAEKIRVGLGEEIGGLEFRLPPSFLVRTIEGEVVWSDGTPAANVDVMLICAKSKEQSGFKITTSPETVKTDDKGQFRLEILTSETYWLEARGVKANKKGETIAMHSPGVKISTNENVKDLKLTVSKEGFAGDCGQ